MTASPLTDDRGKVCGSVHMARDITARKRAEEELRLSNQRLDLLAETAGQLSVSDSPQEIVDSLCWRVMEFLDCDAFFNFLVVDQKSCSPPSQRLCWHSGGGGASHSVARIRGGGLGGCASPGRLAALSAKISTHRRPPH